MIDITFILIIGLFILAVWLIKKFLLVFVMVILLIISSAYVGYTAYNFGLNEFKGDICKNFNYEYYADTYNNETPVDGDFYCYAKQTNEIIKMSFDISNNIQLNNNS